MISLKKFLFKLCICLSLLLNVSEAIHISNHPSVFLLRNGSCTDVCEAPLYQLKQDDDRMLCDICKSGFYLYPDGKCYEECRLPLTIRIDKNGFRSCDNKCSDLGILHSNGSCFEECQQLFELETRNGIQICQKSCDDSFVLMDNSCVQECEFPFIESFKDSIRTCEFPCTKRAEYYYIEENICRNECEAPYLVKEINECSVKMCYLGHMLAAAAKTKKVDVNIKIYSILSKLGQFFTGIGATISTAIGSGNPASFSLAGFIKMLPYIRYLQIKYPERLIETLHNTNSSLISFNFGPSMPSDLKSDFKKYPLPGRFDEYQVHSNFLVNYWQILTALGIVLLIIIGLSMAVRITKNKSEILNNIFKKLKLIAHWNFFLMVFCTNMDGIILYTSLQMRTIDLSSARAGDIAGFVVCIMMNVFTVFLFGLVIFIIVDLRRKRALRVVPETVKKNAMAIPWEKFQLFYKGYKDKTWYRHIYMLVFMTRICIFNAVIAYLFDYPFLQAIIITSMSVCMLLYIGFMRPFVSKIVLFQSLTDESILFVMNISMLTLASLDHAGAEAISARNSLGDLIIAMNVAISFSALFYLVLYILQGIKTALHAIRVHKTKGLLSILLIFLAPFEAGGMDMDLLPEGSTAARVRSKEDEKHRSYTHIATTSPTEDIKIRFPTVIGVGGKSTPIKFQEDKQTSIVFDMEFAENGSKNLIPSTVQAETLRSLARKQRIRKLTSNKLNSISEQNTERKTLINHPNLLPSP